MQLVIVPTEAGVGGGGVTPFGLSLVAPRTQIQSFPRILNSWRMQGAAVLCTCVWGVWGTLAAVEGEA